MPLISSKVVPSIVIYTDCYRSDNALDVSAFYHEGINHSKLFGRGKNHINGIENFWNQAKRVLKKYNCILKESFTLFMKKCEFRFTYETPKEQLAILKNCTGLLSVVTNNYWLIYYSPKNNIFKINLLCFTSPTIVSIRGDGQ